MIAPENHRIATVEVFDVASRYPRAVGRNARLGHHGSGPTSAAALITTDQGATGWALTNGRVDTDTIAWLTGRPLREVFDPATGVTDPRAAALDLPLHDLAGVILGQPVHRLIAGPGSPAGTPPAIACYSGAIYFDDLDPEDAPAGIDAVLRNVAQDHAAGYRQLKLKVGRGHRWVESGDGLARDVTVTRAVREAYPDLGLMVDANDGFTPETAARFVRETAGCGLIWLEEPFPEDRASLVGLREAIARDAPALLVAEGESGPDVPAVLGLATDGLVDVLLMDIVTYGPTAWRDVMPAVRDAGARISPHAWGHPLKSLYTAQLVTGLGDCPTVEGVPGTCDGVDMSGYRLEDGLLHLPDAPGFGIPVPPDLVART